MKNIPVKWAISWLIFSHFCGIVFLFIPALRDWALSFSGLNLLLAFLVTLSQTRHQTRSFMQLASVVFGIAVLGFIAEAVGVATGFPFGAYQYGTRLGWKILEVPPVIGLNWAGLVLSFVVLFEQGSLQYNLTTNKWMRALYVGLAMMVFDFFLEPVAIKLAYWNWEQVAVPPQNYASWAILSAVFSLLIPSGVENKVAITYVAVQWMFFMVVSFLAP